MIVLPIKTGYTLVSSAVPNRNTHHFGLAYTGLLQSKKKRIKVPVKCFYIHVKGHSFLIDAGWSKECVSNPKKHLGFGLYFASEPVIKSGEACVDQLKAKGIKISDIDGIYMTHLDCDHVSGCHDFKDKNIYASEDEIKYAKHKKIRYGKLVNGLKIKPLLFKIPCQSPFNSCYDVLNDGSVIAYLTPTHSKGSLIYRVNEGDKFVLIVGDNGYNEDSWKNDFLPGPIYNKKNTLKALNWINEQSKDKNCLGVFCAHDLREAKEISI
jgi:N-acyl homoserine lactone hydrolase